ncbi:hypothetical protein DV738_g2420, partial [Chaetothyriales sp. CBS 135597]
MGSVSGPDVILKDAPTIPDPDPVVPKIEPGQDNYDSPSDSSPEQDNEGEPVPEKSSDDPPPPPPKRKGGRKPIYASSEERKQRNRQAQAAFRERRTEYIKQLETTIQHHEEQLQSLQQSHRQAADECLMLRYKNSLLERILLEKGIDVQAELALKGSPHLQPARGPSIRGQASSIQKAMMNRQQQVRQRPVLAPPLQSVNIPSLAGDLHGFTGLPAAQPTPPSQHSSPATARSPGFALQGSISSPSSDLPPPQSQHPQGQRPLPPGQHSQFSTQQRSHMRQISMSNTAPSSQLSRPPSSRANSQSNYYSNAFPKHFDQLEQEYNAPVDLIDDVDGEDVDTDSFIPNFRLPPSTSAGGQAMQASPPMTTSTGSESAGGFHGIDPFDPMLDADPFGVSISIAVSNADDEFAIKNLYELLGNTSDQDSDREPEPPTKAIDKPAARHGKRDAPKEAPTEPASGTRGRGHGGNRSGGFTGNEAAFRDRANRRFNNRDQPTTEGQEGSRPVRRGGRGDRGPRRGGDRHSRTGISEHPKQEGHGWGEQTGNGEWTDEKAGAAIAAADNKEAKEENEAVNDGAEPVANADGHAGQDEAFVEEEDKSKSYAEYVAEQAQKKLEGLGLKEARAPNEGADASKKWSAAKELTKDGEEHYFKGGDKARRERERTQKKEFLDIDYSFKESGFYEVQQATVAGNRIPSLFSTLDEQYHQQLRRSVNHAFSMSALVQYEPSVNEILELFLDRTDELYASTKEVCPLSQWFQGYAFDVIGKITYSEDHGFIRNNEDIEGMIAKLHKIFDYAGPVGQIPFLDVLLIKNPILLLLDRWGFQWTAFPVAAFARRRLGERLYKADAPTDTSGRTDLLSMFLKAKADRPQFFTDRSVLTMSISMSFAGSDTTAISLSAVMYYLIRNRRCYDTVVEEIDAAVREGRIEDRQPSRIVSWTESRQLPYLDACIKEAFRCHPAAGLPLERVTPEQGIDIDGHYIPGGTIVGVNAWVLHKRPEVFDPEQRFPVSEYIPERWLEASKEQLKTMDGNMFQFGAGSRTCIGKNVSLLEIYKTIPSLLRRFEITFANPDPKDDWELWNGEYNRREHSVSSLGGPLTTTPFGETMSN